MNGELPVRGSNSRSGHGRLLYDTARSDPAVGVRGGLRIDRSLMFLSPNYSVDLVLHPGKTDWCCAYGQVIERADGLPVVDAEVCFEGASPPVRTDDMGQFTVGIGLSDVRQVLRVETRTGPVTCMIPSLAEASQD